MGFIYSSFMGITRFIAYRACGIRIKALDASEDFLGYLAGVGLGVGPAQIYIYIYIYSVGLGVGPGTQT